MNDLPPFAPPYLPVSAEFAKAMIEAEQRGGFDNGMDVSPKNSVKAPGPVASTRGDVTFLKVPFAEKDGVKALGARWDAAAKKWYVPQGKDLEAFRRWLPD